MVRAIKQNKEYPTLLEGHEQFIKKRDPENSEKRFRKHRRPAVTLEAGHERSPVASQHVVIGFLRGERNQQPEDALQDYPRMQSRRLHGVRLCAP